MAYTFYPLFPHPLFNIQQLLHGHHVIHKLLVRHILEVNHSVSTFQHGVVTAVEVILAKKLANITVLLNPHLLC